MIKKKEKESVVSKYKSVKAGFHLNKSVTYTFCEAASDHQTYVCTYI